MFLATCAVTETKKALAMDSNTYDQIIKNICASSGIEDWPLVARSGHILLGERLIGLIHDADNSQSHELSVFVQFDSIDTQSSPEFYRHLLCANLSQTQNLKGYFGLHPVTGQVIYCLRLAMDLALQVAELPALLVSETDAAERWLEGLNSQTASAGHFYAA